MPEQPFFIPDSNSSGTLQGSLFGGPSTPTITPEGKTFTDRLDNTFKSTLKSIGLMYLVLKEIDKKQDRAIELLEIGIKANESIDNKVEKLQETLEELMDGRLRDKDDADRRRREEDLEKQRVAFTETSITEEDTKVPDFWTKSLPTLAIGVGVAALLADNRESISAFLGFIRSTSSTLAYFGGTAAGAITSSRLANPAMVSGLSSAMKMGGGPAVNVATPSRTMLSLLKWLKWLQKAAWFLLLVDPLVTAASAYLFGTNGEPFKRIMMKSFGRVAGGYLGSVWIGSLGALLGSVVGPAGSVVGLVCGAVAGGYYGVEIGEMIGAALYDLFASDMQDWSGFTKIWDKISNDIASGLDAAAMSVGGAINSGLNQVGLGIDVTAPSKPPVFGGNTPSVAPSVLPNVSRVSSNVEGMHRAVSARTGMSVSEMKAFGDIESSNDPSVQTGSYQGLYQLHKDGPGDEFDPQVQVDRMSNDINSSKKFFKKYVGREPSAAEIYLLHQQGQTGGTALVLAYYRGDKMMKAAEGIVKHAKLPPLNTTLSVDKIKLHIYSNIGWSRRAHKALLARAEAAGIQKTEGNLLRKKWVADNITVGEMYALFISGVNDRVATYEAKEGTPGEKPSMTSTPADVETIKQNINFKTGPNAADVYQAESGTYAMASILTEEGLITDRVTGVKDQHHMDKYGPNNTHNRGLAIDFTIAPGTDSSSVVKRIYAIAKEAGVSVVVKDFYANRNAGFPPHIHVEFASKAEADRFMTYYKNRKSPQPVPTTPNSGDNLIAMKGEKDKPKVVIVQGGGNKQASMLNAPMPQSRPGVSGAPPAAYNYNIPAFLNGIT